MSNIGGKDVHVTISAPNLQLATFEIRGTAPLVVHRMSAKLKEQLRQKQEEGKTASSKRNRKPQDGNQTYLEARYISRDGWDGINAASIRAAMINACRLVDYKMVLARMSIFVLPDGWDEKEPQIPLIRIYGKAKRQDDLARVDNGNPYVTIRAAFYEWSAKVRIRFDADQFALQDVTNLLSRVGNQVGLCEGRPFSKNSAGMGWGTFEIVPAKEKAA